MILKKRLAKVSARGLYLQDRELMDTDFLPGKAIRFVIDQKNRTLVILPTEDPSGENHVSKRQMRDGLKPVIDIRCQEAKNLFQDSDYLQVTIYSDRVLVEGFVDNEGTTDIAEKQGLGAEDILSLAQLTTVKKLSEIVLSIRDLEQVVGQCGHVLNQKECEIPLEFISLFSGAGLMDIGFLKNGFRCVYAIEKERCAVENYRRNLGDHVVCGDVNDVNNLLDAPVAIAGPPCQDLSPVNSRRFLESDRNRLIRRYIELVGASDCKVFVLENVPQIITAGRFKEDILNALGDQFDISYGVLEAADMGAAQYRKRAFFIGSKIGPISLPEPVVSAYMTVRDAFRGLTSNLPNQQDITRSSSKVLERLKHIRPGRNYLDAPESSVHRGHFSHYCKRLDYDRPSVAIVNYRKAMIVHPEEDRILSVREAARLQGVPDEYIFSGPLGQMQQQVANGVPVPLAFQIARVIRQAIEKYNARLSYGLC